NLNKKEKARILLQKYSSGTCSESELRQLLWRLEDDPELYGLLDETVNKDWREQALFGEKDKLTKDQKRNFRLRLNHWVAAASVLLVLTAGLAYWFTKDSGSIAYYTDYGERQQFELPDGSTVELNANSQLIWNKNWSRSGVRSVILNGEAYFDVVKRNGAKFQVKANETIVNVLGTSFNVSNRRGETEIFLHEGKVELVIPDEDKLIMEPGEKVAYQEQTRNVVKTEQETVRSAAAWRVGVISFQKVALKDIIPELNDIYGIRLVCPNPQLEEKIMDVGVPYMDWDATKTSLELAMNVAITESDGEYIIELKE